MRRAAPLVAAAALVAGGACRNFGEPPAPALLVTPDSLTFSGAADGQSPPTRALAMSPLGSGRLTWTAQADVPWLSVSPASDTAPALAWVKVGTVGLAVGSYRGAITVAAGGGSHQRVSVPVTLVLSATLSLGGQWTGVGTHETLTLTLVDLSGVLAGSGWFNPPQRPVTVAGTFRNPAVVLTLTDSTGTAITFTGSLDGDNTLIGTLSGGAVSGDSAWIFRQ